MHWCVRTPSQVSIVTFHNTSRGHLKITTIATTGLSRDAQTMDQTTDCKKLRDQLGIGSLAHP